MHLFRLRSARKASIFMLFVIRFVAFRNIYTSLSGWKIISETGAKVPAFLIKWKQVFARTYFHKPSLKPNNSVAVELQGRRMRSEVFVTTTRNA